ncbi:MAG: DNA polymerase III subunit delta [Eubacterium sp.]|nr:DNA polymerase III subunit delta [Eubacterium sp.]
MVAKKTKENPTNKSINTIREHISSGNFSRVYLLYGTEAYLINQMRDELLDALGVAGNEEAYQKYTNEKYNINDVRDFVTSFPFFTEHNVVLVQSSGHFKTSDDSVTELISNIPESNVLIFCEYEVDRNKVAFKHLSQHPAASVLEFTLPEVNDLKKWIGILLSRDGVRVKLSVPDHVLDVLGPDINMLLLENEMNKLHDYCLTKGTVLDEDVDLMCLSNIEDQIFKMCTLISQKKSAQALILYNNLLKLKANPYNIIRLITRQYNLILSTKQLIKDGAKMGEIMKALKLRDFAAREMMALANSYKEYEIIKCTDLCHEATNMIMTGTLTQENAAENLIIKLLTA